MRASAICAVLFAIACAAPDRQAPAAQQAPAVRQPGDVAARVGDRAITLGELDERWKRDEPAGQAQAIQQMYDGRKAALDAIVADMLIAEAAGAAGVDADTYTRDQVASRVEPVTDAQVLSFFQANQAEMQGRGMDVMGPVIRQYLQEQARAAAYDAMVSELRAAGPPIDIVIDAPRYAVEVGPDDPVAGNPDAPVTIVEFSDFQCPFCARVMPTLKRLRETYGDRVRVVWKDFPLTSIHPQAFGAAQAAHCAQEQDKFWEYHDQLFANQQALLPDSLKLYAADAGLDADAFAACLDTARYADRVQEQMGIGRSLGVSSTPTVFVNGRMVAGAQPYEVFTRIIDEELERAGR